MFSSVLNQKSDKFWQWFRMSWRGRNKWRWDVCVLQSWGSLTVHEPPVEQRVVDEGLQHGHNTVPVLSQHLHHCVAGDAVVPIQACHLAAIRNKVSKCTNPFYNIGRLHPCICFSTWTLVIRSQFDLSFNVWLICKSFPSLRTGLQRPQPHNYYNTC